MNELAPFNVKQVDYLNRCRLSWFNVCEGGKRGGKNVLQCLAFCQSLEHHPNKIHLISGVSIATARLNILDCDGYGFLNYFEGRYREGEYKGRTCLYIQTFTGEKVVLVSGGGKSGDEKLIKGNSYGMAMITESNECHPVFLKETFDRTLASKNRKIFHDLNPKSEGHWYYEDVLNFHEKKQRTCENYGYNYGHFTIADNMSITDSELKTVLGTYDKNDVWYIRDILGQRKQTEGLIYSGFRTSEHVVEPTERKYEQYFVSNDYGTKHPCVFLLFGLCEGVWYLVDEYYHNGEKQGQKTVEDYYKDLLKFVGDRIVWRFILDQAPIAASFNIYLKRIGQFPVTEADNTVSHGIEDVRSALKTGILKINKNCKNTIKEFGLYSYDPKSQADDPIKENDDCMDCLRYFVRTKRIITPKRKSIFDKKGE